MSPNAMHCSSVLSDLHAQKSTCCFCGMACREWMGIGVAPFKAAFMSRKKLGVILDVSEG
jgi:hypothetical protein